MAEGTSELERAHDLSSMVILVGSGCEGEISRRGSRFRSLDAMVEFRGYFWYQEAEGTM